MGFGVAFEILKTARYMKSGMKYPAIMRRERRKLQCRRILKM
jgi:hypothetical protein